MRSTPLGIAESPLRLPIPGNWAFSFKMSSLFFQSVVTLVCKRSKYEGWGGDFQITFSIGQFHFQNPIKTLIESLVWEEKRNLRDNSS